MRFVAIVFTCVLGLWPYVASAQSAAPPCQFELGFKTLHDMLATTVGNCLEDENHNPTNGDGLQHTTGGLLVWRKLDNWTAFTDGFHTWINGPQGLQERLNSDRFPWEVINMAGRAASDLPGTPIDLGTTLTSIVDSATKRHDVYAVNVPIGKSVHVVFTKDADSSSAVIDAYKPGTSQLFNTDGNLIGGTQFIGPYYFAGTCNQYAAACSFNFNAAISGTYYVIISASSDSGLKYTLHVF